MEGKLSFFCSTRNCLLRIRGGDERVPQIKGKEKQKSSLKHNGLKIKVTTRNEALFHSLQKGSLTVETAFVLSWFLFVMATVLFLFRILQLQYKVGEALDKAVAEAALLRESPENVENMVKLLFYKELVKQDCPTSMILLGSAGFYWNESEIDSEYLNMKIEYKIKMPRWILKNRKLEVIEASKCRRWNGVPGNGNRDVRKEWVYITPEGSVYHRSRECTHLKLSIESVLTGDTRGYRACIICAEGREILSLIYIAKEGACYHIKLNCRGLKRTIYMIPLAEKGGRSPCLRCGGK